MCNCIKKLEEKLVSKGTYKGKKITKATYECVALMIDPIETKPYAEVKVEVEGMKKPQIQNVIFSYCPFCGKEFSAKK